MSAAALSKIADAIEGQSVDLSWVTEQLSRLAIGNLQGMELIAGSNREIADAIEKGAAMIAAALKARK